MHENTVTCHILSCLWISVSLLHIAEMWWGLSVCLSVMLLMLSCGDSNTDHLYPSLHLSLKRTVLTTAVDDSHAHVTISSIQGFPGHPRWVVYGNNSTVISSLIHFLRAKSCTLYYLLITKGPTGHLQCYTKTQKYNKTQWHKMTHKKSVGPK